MKNSQLLEFIRNYRKFTAYNDFRKRLFAEISPRESDYILHLLPWLLSINHPACPGFVADIKKIFRVSGIERDAEIRNREPEFKKMFGLTTHRSLIVPLTRYFMIQGLYTIGSVGTIGQTASSDCDIWICYDKDDLDPGMWNQLKKKVYLIKDWLDEQIRIPVYFFFSDINDVRNGYFGAVDAESSGSLQKNLLKEEFYRTCIVISGKIPLWWVCFGSDSKESCLQTLSELNQNKDLEKNLMVDDFVADDFIDLGNVRRIEESEYFGGALWQLQKSMTRPLKSIIKMFLLKMQFDAPDERLILDRFRESVFTAGEQDGFPDPLVFTMEAILSHYHGTNVGLAEFLKECFYLRCEIKPDFGSRPIRNQLARSLFEKYPIEKNFRRKLSRFDTWDLDVQIRLGERLSRILIQVYNEIIAVQSGVACKINKRDLIILGRKIAACYQKKDHKIVVLPKPRHELNLSTLTLALGDGIWRVYAGSENDRPLFSNTDIIQNIAFIVWNGLLLTSSIRMTTNASSVTLQEIINLGKKIKTFLGTCDVFNIDYSLYFKKTYITRLLIIVSFEKNPWEKDINDLAAVYTNSWGELFVERFKSPHMLDVFLKKSGLQPENIEIGYYLQRNCMFYEKIAERTRKIISFLKNRD